MLAEQMRILGYVTVIETCNTHIEYNIEQVRKVEQRKIGTKLSQAYGFLDISINKKYPERLNG